MGELVEELNRRLAEGDRQGREQVRDSARREYLTALCGEVADWSPANVVEPGWRTADADDAVVQLAWAVRNPRH